MEEMEVLGYFAKIRPECHIYWASGGKHKRQWEAIRRDAKGVDPYGVSAMAERANRKQARRVVGMGYVPMTYEYWAVHKSEWVIRGYAAFTQLVWCVRRKYGKR